MAAHILLVDDDKDFQDVIATKLRASGFEIAVANDGEEAVKKAAEVKPDLVLMDVNMPKLDGVGALLKIKDIAGMQNLKVILFTAFGDPQPEIYKNDQRFAKELGAFEYLLKSQDLDEIVERIRKTLEGNPS